MASTGHKFNALRIEFSSNLEREAVYHILFLKRVDEAGYLKETSVLKRAIYRYEKYWLPLAADYPNECLSAPLGIEWIWHCHMLCPHAYERDCLAIVNRPVNHKLREPNDYKSAQLKSQSYWSKKYEYDHEPFHVDYTAPYDGSVVDSFKSRLSYDILSAAQRQMSFYYEVSLPHYQDPKFLQSSIYRYKMFIYLKRQLPEEFLVPCYDIDLMWHTHQLSPFTYKTDMFRLLGIMLNHDDSTTDRNPGSKLSVATAKTREHWMHFFNECFTFFGAMYRGKPPAGFLHMMTDEEIMSFCTKSCSITIDQMTLNVSPETVHHKKRMIIYSYTACNDVQQARMFKVQIPPNSPVQSAQIKWCGNRNAYNFNSRMSNSIKFILKGKAGFCLGSNVEMGSNYVSLLPYLEEKRNLQNGGTFHERIQLGQHFSLEVIGQFSKPLRSGVLLNLHMGRYEMAKVSENIQDVWGPVSLERLTAGMDNRCQVASHRLTNHMGNTEFTVRTIHSAPLLMSVVQVFFRDKMSAVAHIVASDQLPLPTQVDNRDGRSVTLNPKQGERAVLIKNHAGDWGLVTGRWDGYRQGIAPVGGNPGQHGFPGALHVKFYRLPSIRRPWELVLDYQSNRFDFQLASASVDLLNGSIVLDAACNDVAENIALAFSVSLLHVLCVPRPQNWKEGQRVKPPEITRGSRPVKSIPSDDMVLIVAAGLLISAPSNYYFHKLHGTNLCAMCGGGVIGYNHTDPMLAGSTYGYGHSGSGCGGGICSSGCGGCSGGCGGGGCGGGGCGGGGCGGCGGGCGGCG